MEALQLPSVDVEGSLRRFGQNAGMYERFLLRFLEDPNFKAIGAALNAEDWEAMLSAAHTLKGVAGNLGMRRLFDACGQTVRHLRANDRASAKASYAELEAAYLEVCGPLQSYKEKRA